MLDALVNNKRIVGLGVFNSRVRGTILAGYIEGTNCTFKFTSRPAGYVFVRTDDARKMLAREIQEHAYPNACSHAKNKYWMIEKKMLTR
jgi:hypothetical protein